MYVCRYGKQTAFSNFEVRFPATLEIPSKDCRIAERHGTYLKPSSKCKGRLVSTCTRQGPIQAYGYLIHAQTKQDQICVLCVVPVDSRCGRHYEGPCSFPSATARRCTARPCSRGGNQTQAARRSRVPILPKWSSFYHYGFNEDDGSPKTHYRAYIRKMPVKRETFDTEGSPVIANITYAQTLWACMSFI